MNKTSLATMPLEELVPADIFKAEVRRWAERIDVQPKGDSHPPNDSEVGELLNHGTTHLRHRLTSSARTIQNTCNRPRACPSESPEPRQALPEPCARLSLGKRHSGRQRNKRVPDQFEASYPKATT